MVTKGIIKSIDYNGNTCKVRVPILESACDDAEIVLSAIFATAPGIFNGYKEEDVVIVSFEDNNYENAIILGKLYLGASKENEDPRGTVSCTNLKSENQATIPLSSKLVYDAKDKNTANVKGSYNDYKTLADIVDGLQTQKTEIGSLNVKIIDDGENWGAEIQRLTKENTLQTSKINQNADSITAEVSRASEAEGELDSKITQTAESINATVLHKHQDGSQNALGWDLTTDSWKINAQDTITDENGETKVKDINIVTIDRSGMSIAGDLKLNGYPKNIVVRYTQNDSDTDYPNLYNFKPDSFPDTEIDKTWYYNKYIKIIEEDKEKYILISSENIDNYTITPGETMAYVYNLEEINTEWKTETPARVDGKYIWQWTHTESFSFNGDSWDEKDDDKVVCITGAQGEKGNTGIAITATKQWYILWPADAAAADKPSKPGSTEKPEPDEPENTAAPKEWMSTPPEAVNGYVVWTCQESIFSDDAPENRHIKYSDPVKDNAYALAQGKTTNYYSDTDPSKAYSVKKGDCWFDTGYVKIDTPATKTGYLGKFIVSTTGNILVKADETDSNRYIPDAAGSTRLIKITPNNIDDGLFTVKTEDTAGTDAYETGNLKQWDGDKWEDIAGELVTNKLTANYINALDITAKKITVLNNNNAAQSDSNPILFEANGLSGTGSVKIANFMVKNDKLYSGTHDNINSPDAGIYLGKDGLSIGSNFKITTDSVIISDYTKSITKKYCKVDFAVVTDNNKPDWWENWDSTNWNTTPPNREDGKYIWEWTKEIKGNSTDDIRTWEDKGKICITGSKGDPGTNGKTPYIKNGTWWVDDKDTGIKAQGAQGAPGNTPYIKNGNWWIGNDDTGIKAEGTDGASITAVKEYYLATSLSSGVTVNTTGWSEKIQNITADNKYLWNYEEILSNDTVINTTKPCIIGVYGDKGNPGRGISSITNYYLTSNNNSGITDASDGWKTTPQPTSDTSKYLWNYEVVAYTDGTTTKTTPCIIGVHGEKGDPGATGRSVLSVTKYYKLAASEPKPPADKDKDWEGWSITPPNFETGKNYYESELTIYNSVVDGKNYSWSAVVKNSMMTVEFINSLGVIAKKIEVTDGASPNPNVIFSASSAENKVNIGGFTVDSNRLYAGTPGSSSGIELSSYLPVGLIAYSSNNQRKASTYAVSKITVNKATDLLTVYIRSYAEPNYDYIMISNPNTQTYPTDYSSGYIKAHTYANPNSGSTLASYTKVEYHDLKQNDWIYVVYRKDWGNDVDADTGYFLIPETADVSISNVGDCYFVRDPAFDIRGASIKVGTNFSVDSTGAIKSTSGTIGKLSITNDGLVYKSSSTSFKIGQESSDPRMPKYAIYSSAQRIDDCIMGLKDYQDYNYWVEFKPDGYYTYRSSDSTSAVVTGKIPYDKLKNICWLNTALGQQQYTGSKAICPQIIVLEATNVSSTSPQTFSLSNYGINEIIGAQITEKRAATSSGVSGVSGHWFKVDEETGKKITIYNSSAVNRTYSVLVIAI